MSRPLKLLFYVSFFCINATVGFANDNNGIQRNDSIVGREKIYIDNLLKQYSQNFKSNPYQALEYAAQALQIAEKSKDSLQIGRINRLIGHVHFSLKVYYLAMQYYFRAYKIFDAKNLSEYTAYSLIDIGKSYFTQNVFDIALNYYGKSRAIFEKQNDKIGLCEAFTRIGEVYLMQNFSDSAIYYLSKAGEIIGENTRTLQHAELNILEGKAFGLGEDFKNAINKLNAAIIIFRSFNNNHKIAEVYTALGNIYMKKGTYEFAKEQYQKALSIYEPEDDKEHTAELKYKLGYIYNVQRQYTKALELAKTGLEMALNENLNDTKCNIFLLYSDIYSNINNPALALEYHRKYSEIKDSIASENDKEQFTELQVSLETQRQEVEIEMLKKEQAFQDAELQRKKIANYSLVAGILFSLLFAIYFVYINKKMSNTNKLLTQKNVEINQQKEEIEIKNSTLEIQKEEITRQKNIISQKNENIQASINYASRIQVAMLPQPQEIKNILPDSFIFLKPKDVVSGDFYWFSTIPPKDCDPEKIIIAAIDCTGHGIPGAFMSMMADAYLNLIVNIQNITEPDKILNRLHIHIREGLNQSANDNRDGMDMALCVIDKKNKTLQFAGAASPMIYVQNNQLYQLKGDNVSIAGLQRENKRSFTMHQISIEQPTSVYIFSDGFQDQFGGKNKQKFMRKNFIDMLSQIHTDPMEDQKLLIDLMLRHWMNGNDQIDDVLVIGFKV